jgi:hypothetical protein
MTVKVAILLVLMTTTVVVSQFEPECTIRCFFGKCCYDRCIPFDEICTKLGKWRLSTNQPECNVIRCKFGTCCYNRCRNNTNELFCTENGEWPCAASAKGN